MHVRSWPNKLVWRDDGFGWLYAVVVSLHKWGGWLHAGNRHTHETRGYGQTANWHKSGVPSKHGRGRGSAPLILGTSWYSGTNLHAPQVSPPAVGGNLRIATMHPWLFSQVVIVGFFPGEYAVFVERILNAKFVFMYSHTLRCMWVSFGSFLRLFSVFYWSHLLRLRICVALASLRLLKVGH